MTRIVHRSIAHTYPVAVRGEGIHIWDATGKQYIDASGGATVSCLGHSHPDVLAAMHAQLDKLAYAHTSFFTTQVADRAGKEPFDPRHKLHARIKQEAIARGLMVYPMGGTLDGVRGDHVLLAPPFIATAADIDTIVERLGDAADAAIPSLARSYKDLL